MKEATKKSKVRIMQDAKIVKFFNKKKKKNVSVSKAFYESFLLISAKTFGGK